MVAKIKGTGSPEFPDVVLEEDGGTGVASSNIQIQSVRVDDGEVATGTTIIPLDDTIPQITEGDEYLSVSITPNNAANILKIEAQLHMSSSAGLQNHVVALFKDSGANAIKAIYGTESNSTYSAPYNINHEEVAGSVSPITFKIRAGGVAAGTTTVNGFSGARIFGGVLNSYIKVTEVTP